MSIEGAVEVAQGAVVALLGVLAVPVLCYFVVINTTYLVIVGLAALEVRSQARRHRASVNSLGGALTPGVSLVVPAHNEEAGIVPAVTALLSLRYPRYEVVVVDDGSSDATLDRLVQAFDLVQIPRAVPSEVPVVAPVRGVYIPRDGRSRLLVVSKENSGKTEAVNTGINASAEPLVAVIDADSILEPDALLRVAQPFSDDPIRMVAAGGTIRAANDSRVVSGRVVRVNLPRRWLPRIQVVEYFRAFMLGRAGWSRMGGLILISGAFGIFRRDVLVEVGGLDHGSIGEDFELVMRMHRHLRDEGREYRMKFVAEPVSWTEVPETLKVLRNQRRRWHRGLWETLWAYRGMLFRPRYGRVGWLALPYYWLFELAAPLIEGLGIVVLLLGLALRVIDVPFALLFLALAYGYAIFVSLCALAVEEYAFHRHDRRRDLFLIVVASLAENFGFRQLTVWWRLEGWWASLRRRKAVWGVMTRTGFADTEASPAAAAPDQDRAARR